MDKVLSDKTLTEENKALRLELQALKDKQLTEQASFRLSPTMAENLSDYATVYQIGISDSIRELISIGLNTTQVRKDMQAVIEVGAKAIQAKVV